MPGPLWKLAAGALGLLGLAGILAAEATGPWPGSYLLIVVGLLLLGLAVALAKVGRRREQAETPGPPRPVPPSRKP